MYFDPTEKYTVSSSKYFLRYSMQCVSNYQNHKSYTQCNIAKSLCKLCTHKLYQYKYFICKIFTDIIRCKPILGRTGITQPPFKRFSPKFNEQKLISGYK